MASPSSAMSRNTRGCDDHSCILGLGQNTGKSAGVTVTGAVISLMSRGSYARQPVLLLGGTAIDGLEEQGLQLLRHRAAAAAADRTVVQLANRRDLGRGAGE